MKPTDAFKHEQLMRTVQQKIQGGRATFYMGILATLVTVVVFVFCDNTPSKLNTILCLGIIAICEFLWTICIQLDIANTLAINSKHVATKSD